MVCKNATILNLNEDAETYITGRKMKKLLPSLYKRKKTKIPKKNELRVVYNWLRTLDLIPDNIDPIGTIELEANIKRVSYLYLVNNKDLFEMFY